MSSTETKLTNYDEYIHEPNNENIDNIPGDKGKFLVGHGLNYLVDPLPFCQERYEKYGSVFKINTFGVEF